MHEDLATHAEALSTAQHAPVTGWHALAGMQLGYLRGLAPGTDVPIHVAAIAEEAADLAVADRVAYVLTQRTGTGHVALAASDRYLVAQLTPELDWAAAMRLVPMPHMPRIVSVASAEGILPILLPATA